MDLTSQLDALHARYHPTNRVTPRRDWYQIDNATGTTAEIRIYDEIGWFGVTASEFVADLDAITASQINLRINSPGGSVFDGIAIYTSLINHPAKVHVTIEGLAASIASVIAMAGDTITIAPAGMMMVHDGIGLAVGNAADHRELADLLDKVSDTIAGVYAAATDGDQATWRQTMRDETWYNADEALAAGLVDQIGDTALTAEFDISVFTNAPTRVPNPPTGTKDNNPLTAALSEAIRKAVAA